jgi:hypothetical protein
MMDLMRRTTAAIEAFGSDHPKGDIRSVAEFAQLLGRQRSRINPRRLAVLIDSLAPPKWSIRVMVPESRGQGNRSSGLRLVIWLHIAAVLEVLAPAIKLQQLAEGPSGRWAHAPVRAQRPADARPMRRDLLPRWQGHLGRDGAPGSCSRLPPLQRRPLSYH